MKFLADECCDTGLVEALRQDKIDIVYVIEFMRGASDTEILSYANKTGRTVITEDKDFGELVYRFRLPVRGIILLRFGIDEAVLKTLHLRSLITRMSDRLVGNFVVLDADKTRFRPLTSPK